MSYVFTYLNSEKTSFPNKYIYKLFKIKTNGQRVHLLIIYNFSQNFKGFQVQKCYIFVPTM